MPHYRILLLYGGCSQEHEISCISAGFIFESLLGKGYVVLPVYVDLEGNWFLNDSVSSEVEQNQGIPCYANFSDKELIEKGPKASLPFDFVFPIIHGQNGEDGRLQGMLEFFNIPFAGSGHLTSTLCMDKFYGKCLFQNSGFPVLDFMKVDLSDWEKWPNQIGKEILSTFKFPIFVKPCNMGSSIGISRVSNSRELAEAVEYAFEYDHQVLVEQGASVRELEVAIIGNYPEYKVSDVGEIRLGSGFYSYEEKYIHKNAELIIPAEISLTQKKSIQSLAAAAFRMLNGDGFARVDFFLDTKSNQIYLNEINTLPGFTSISMFPKLWSYQGIKAGILIAELIQLGMERMQRRKAQKPLTV